MTRNLISFAAVAVAASITLSACRNEPETVVLADPQRDALAKAPPVKELPPSIQDSRTYRCADNSLVYVDFYTNNTAQLRTSETGQPTQLRAEGGNPPYRAEGYSVASNAARTSITVPSRGTQSCHE
jgi:hypothetical protein